MKFRAILLSVLLICSTFLAICIVCPRDSAQTILSDDDPDIFPTPSPDQFEFSVNSDDHAIIGIRQSIGVNYDLEVYTNTSFITLIEGSYEPAGEIDFVAMDKSVWASPPDRGAIVSAVSGTGDYLIEMENDLPDVSFGSTFIGSIDVSLGGPVVEEGPATWDGVVIAHCAVLFDGSIYHMWYSGNDHTSWGDWEIGYANSTDGKNWTKYSGNPVLTMSPSGWDDNSVASPSVYFDGTTYHMWYMGGDGSVDRIGYANSTDRVTWSKYTGNPVVNNGAPGLWDDNIISGPHVIYNGTGYEMWYHGHDGSNYRIGYASSPDGLTWNKYGGNPVLDLGSSGSWDDETVSCPSVYYDGITYHMWYNGNDGSNLRIGYATSPDGIAWTKYAGNPVLDIGPPSSWDDAHVYAPWVWFDGTGYQMWYTGRKGSITRIGYANSTDGINWTKIVIDVEVFDAFELSGANAGTIYNITMAVPLDADFDMFLLDLTQDDAQARAEATLSSENIGTGISESIMFTAAITGVFLLVVTNPDGDTGTYTINAGPIPILLDDTPIMGGEPFPDYYQFEVLSEDHTVVGVRPRGGDDCDLGIYTDTFSSVIDSSITVGDNVDFVVLDKTEWPSPPNLGARVTSGSASYVIEMENDVDDHLATDTWSGAMETIPGNPVLDMGLSGSWEDFSVFNPHILYDGMIYHMWYAGNDGTNRRMGYANSTDGITWTKYQGNPVLDLGPPGSWDEIHVNLPKILYDGATYHMWYKGRGVSNSYRIGYANSSNGLSWMKYAGNPVLDLGPPGSWDDYEILSHAVLYNGTTYQIWYAASDGTNLRIGYATSPDGITWAKFAGNPVLDLGSSGSWDDVHVSTTTVVDDGTTLHMWYSGDDGINNRIGYATSPDGITWTKFAGNPVLDLGTSGSWDDLHISDPSVVFNNGVYHMWYQGDDSSNKRIGYANSSDGINWTKLTIKEVLDAYEINGLIAGSFYALDLEVSETLDLDMFIFNTTGGRNDAIAYSTDIGPSINESLGFTAPTSGDYLLVITNENGGIGPYTINPPTNLTGSGTPIASGDVLIGEEDIVMEQLSLSVDVHSVVVTEIQLRQRGTAADAEIEKVYLYDDVNDNGALDMGTDILLDSQLFFNGTLTFTDFTVWVNSGTIENLLIVFDVAPEAKAGNTLNFGMANENYITVETPDTVLSVNFPIVSNTLTIRATDLIVEGTPKKSGQVLIGEKDVMMEQLILTSNLAASTVTSLKVELMGTAEDEDIAYAYLYDDADDDGELSPTDILLDTETFTSETLTFSPLTFTVNPGTPENLLVVLDISDTSTIGHTVGLIIGSKSDVTVEAPVEVSEINFPIISDFIEISGGRISGTVMGLEDGIIEDVIVHLINSGDVLVATETTDESGEFYFEDLIYDTYSMNVTKEGYMPNDSSMATLSLDTPDVDVGIIQLTPIPEPPITTGNIAGSVVDDVEAPIDGAIVQLIDATGSIAATFTTNALGEFEFEDIPFRTYNVSAFAEDFMGNDSALATISSNIPSIDIGNIVLTPIIELSSPTTGSVEGYVYNTDGEPIEGANVKLLDENGLIVANILADSNGFFEFENWNFGKYSINITKSGYFPFGSNEFNLNNLTVSHLVTLASVPSEPELPIEKESIPSWIWLIMFLLIAAIIILLVLYLYAKKKKPEEEVAVTRGPSSEEPSITPEIEPEEVSEKPLPPPPSSETSLPPPPEDLNPIEEDELSPPT